MNQEVLEYLKGQRISVLAVRMPDGTPHAATLHFAHLDEPFTFIFITDPKSRKHEALAGGEAVAASAVIGFVEGPTARTLQLDGVVRLADTPEVRYAYYAKFPDAVQYDEDVFLTFTPTWWRFTDWTKPEGKSIVTSE